MNEAALSNVLADVTFIEAEIKRLERPALDKVFDEVKMVSLPPPPHPSSPGPLGPSPWRMRSRKYS